MGSTIRIIQLGLIASGGHNFTQHSDSINSIQGSIQRGWERGDAIPHPPKMFTSCGKCVYMCVCVFVCVCVCDQPTITLRGNALEAVEEFFYLGSKVGQTARVDGEMSTRLEKAATVYQMWRWKVFRSRSVSKKTKAHVFRVMVMSVLLYGSETWAVTQQDLKRLHVFQMNCLRDIIGVTLWNKRRNEDIMAEVGEIPVEDQVKLRRLQWFGHLQRMPAHQPQRQVLKCRPRGKKRKPGGTSLCWIDVVNRDLSKITNWEDLVKDRAQWRSAIHQLHLPASSTNTV